MKKEAKIISSKGAITPNAKMLEKEGIPVQEVVFMGTPEQFLDLFDGEKIDKDLVAMLKEDGFNETQIDEVLKSDVSTEENIEKVMKKIKKWRKELKKEQ